VKNSHLYMFCDPDTLWHAVPAAQASGFRFWKPIVWDKLTLGMGYHYRRQYEFILFFEKGKRRLQNLGVPDVLRAKRVHGGYPTEKPVEVLRTLVRQSSSPQELVCDPFFGSGSTGEAAILEGRRFIGTDVNVEAGVVAHERLRAAGAQAAGARRPSAGRQSARQTRSGSPHFSELTHDCTTSGHRLPSAALRP
jgi:site-specific DNA-methyltransferase (adenine-specific)